MNQAIRDLTIRIQALYQINELEYKSVVEKRYAIVTGSIKTVTLPVNSNTSHVYGLMRKPPSSIFDFFGMNAILVVIFYSQMNSFCDQIQSAKYKTDEMT